MKFSLDLLTLFNFFPCIGCLMEEELNITSAAAYYLAERSAWAFVTTWQ